MNLQDFKSFAYLLSTFNVNGLDHKLKYNACYYDNKYYSSSLKSEKFAYLIDASRFDPITE